MFTYDAIWARSPGTFLDANLLSASLKQNHNGSLTVFQERLQERYHSSEYPECLCSQLSSEILTWRGTNGHRQCFSLRLVLLIEL